VALRADKGRKKKGERMQATPPIEIRGSLACKQNGRARQRTAEVGGDARSFLFSEQVADPTKEAERK